MLSNSLQIGNFLHLWAKVILLGARVDHVWSPAEKNKFLSNYTVRLELLI